MPLTEFQHKVLRVLVQQRSEESFFAGGAILNVAGPRFSLDFDIFHDSSNRLAETVTRDGAALEKAGLSVDWTLRSPSKHSAVVRGNETEAFALEWVVDSDFRFFPVQADPDFGFVLHPIDIATNKILAAVGREEVRDIVDTMFIHYNVMPLGAAIWAAAGKDPGWSPLGILNEIRRTSRWRQDDLDMLEMSKRVQINDIHLFIQSAGKQAEKWINSMPASEVGVVYLDKDGKASQPSPMNLDGYTKHIGTRGGHWPTNSELLSRMLHKQVPGSERE